MLTFDAKAFLKSVPHQPGVYQMFDRAQKILYVGKAKDLKKRLASYFRCNGQHPRTKNFMAQVANITTIITANESAALLLEYSLIKSLKPRYNIVFKDDRSYPYLLLSDTTYPALSIYRGAPKEQGFYFGPFPSGGQIIYATLLLLQKVFKLRQCSDTIFKSRSRPCLQYQIGRCTAPCVNYVTSAEYNEQVNFAKMFLTGKRSVIVDDITRLMHEAAQRLEFEKAANYREQLMRLKEVQKQHAIIQPDGNVDVVALALSPERVCIDLLAVRHGMVLGNKIFHHELPAFTTPREILATFLVQYYSRQAINLPQQLLLNAKLDITEKTALETAINQKIAASAEKIKILRQIKTKSHKQWLQLALANAEHKLQQKLATHADFSVRFKELEHTLALTTPLQRIECFDVSHHSGEATVVSRVVFTKDGTDKNAYRRYNIKDIVAGDDYAALCQALERRFAHCTSQEIESKPFSLPEVIIIDGGKGQLNIAREILTQSKTTNIALLSIAKGKERKVGKETIYFSRAEGVQALSLPDALLMFLLRIRDEAHRFAIEAQRTNLRKKRLTSPLENIPGIGQKKRDVLLQYFGGWQEIKAASLAELSQVRGINVKLAGIIYAALHNVT